ncbi:MAG: riboflavin synthase [Spirochaetaceae bacterium]|nr:riboflavin synthase [Spirochaetaceae bacterium]
MFTGIVEEIGTLKAVQKGRHSAVLRIQAKKILEDVHIGDSIAVNGICLTVTEFSQTEFAADVMHETLNRTNLGQLQQGSPVNLERAMAANGRFGGHIVSGHVDGTGTIATITRDDNAIWYTIAAAPEILRYIVEKGSITIDGTSLTVARVDSTSFAISAIPHTVAVTILGRKKVGDQVNLENDIIGKYVEKLMQGGSQSSGAVEPKKGGITMDFLAANGF